ncbi:hypothetical protein LNQ52_30645 [Klebsiella pneumoniae subsp. pneumoniae]|nr:hypothetical protein [Klebsiella pneumoniae subsp. pneumoniae]
MMPANSRPAALPMPKLKGAELEGDHADHQANDKEGAEGQQIGHLAVNGDKADAVGHGFTRRGVAC